MKSSPTVREGSDFNRTLGGVYYLPPSRPHSQPIKRETDSNGFERVSACAADHPQLGFSRHALELTRPGSAISACLDQV